MVLIQFSVHDSVLLFLFQLPHLQILWIPMQSVCLPLSFSGANY